MIKINENLIVDFKFSENKWLKKKNLKLENLFLLKKKINKCN